MKRKRDKPDMIELLRRAADFPAPDAERDEQIMLAMRTAMDATGLGSGCPDEAPEMIAFEETAEFPAASKKRDTTIQMAIRKALDLRHRRVRGPSRISKGRRRVSRGMGVLPMAAAIAAVALVITFAAIINTKTDDNSKLTRAERYEQIEQQIADAGNDPEMLRQAKIEAEANEFYRLAENVDRKLRELGDNKPEQPGPQRVPTKQEVFAARLAKVEDSESASEAWQLCRWAREQGLTEEAIEARDLTLLLDRNHLGANNDAGNRFEEGRWFTQAEWLAWQEQKAPTIELTLEQKYDKRIADAGLDPDGLWAVYGWAKSHSDLEHHLNEIAHMVLSLNKRHVGANLAVGNVMHQGEWITREEHEKRIRSVATITKEPPTFLAALGTQPLLTQTDHFDIYAQRPGQTSELRRARVALKKLAYHLEKFANAFMSRHKAALAQAKVDPSSKRVTLAMFTRPASYVSYCNQQGMASAADEGGFVDTKHGAIVLNSPTASIARDYPIYDQPLLAAYAPNTAPRQDQQIVWREGIAAQRRLGRPVYVATSKHFQVAITMCEVRAKLAAKASSDLEKLYAMMSQDGWLYRSPAKRLPLYMCETSNACYNASRIKSPHQHTLGGALQLDQPRWLANSNQPSSYISGGVHLLLQMATGRAAKPIDMFWYREGVAHYYRGKLSGAGDVHPQLAGYAQALLRSGQLVSLNKLMPMTVRSYESKTRGSKTKTALYHAQSWALVHFLMNHPNTKLRRNMIRARKG